MRKPKRRWAWTPKNLRKTRSKDQRYNDIHTLFKEGGGKGSWRKNRKYLKKQIKVAGNIIFSEIESVCWDFSPFYGDHWLNYLPKDHYELILRSGKYSDMSFLEFDYYMDELAPFPKDMYICDYTQHLGDVTPFLRCGDAIDLGLKRHKKAWSPWEHPYW